MTASVSADLLAYDDVYDVYRDPSEAFRPPLDGTVGELFDMRHSFDEVLGGLPSTARAMLRPFFRFAVTADPRHPMRVRLRQNAVDRWRPRAPLLVFHSPDDEEVPYADALASVARLRSRGGHVRVQPLPGFDHVNSWIQAMPRAASWFRTLD